MALLDLVPDPAHEIQIGLLISMLDDVTKEWREEMGEVSIEDIMWQPFPGGHSIGGLLLHMVEVEHFWIHSVASDVSLTQEEIEIFMSENIDQYGISWPTPHAKPLSWYFDLQDTYREKTKAYLLTHTDPETIANHNQTEFTLRWIVQHVVAHEAYHGGQAVLLSLMRSRVA